METLFLAAMVVSLNLVAVGLMIGLQYVEKLPQRNSLIPGTNQKFMYWQDFYCQIYGDVFGLPGIQLAFSYFVYYNGLSTTIWLFMILVATLDAVIFTKLCLGENHKPDYHFPATGKLSWSGTAHSVYHGINIAIAVVTIGMVFSGKFPVWVVAMSVIGGFFYITTNRLDLIAGHFDQIEKT